MGSSGNEGEGEQAGELHGGTGGKRCVSREPMRLWLLTHAECVWGALAGEALYGCIPGKEQANAG